ncbi:hypothetical protein Mapa_001767 [Marchantia paleacea]|nr:hypothetical protein Mapa_001767 [Marchantia paleacea]
MQDATHSRDRGGFGHSVVKQIDRVFCSNRLRSCFVPLYVMLAELQICLMRKSSNVDIFTGSGCTRTVTWSDIMPFDPIIPRDDFHQRRRIGNDLPPMLHPQTWTLIVSLHFTGTVSIHVSTRGRVAGRRISHTANRTCGPSEILEKPKRCTSHVSLAQFIADRQRAGISRCCPRTIIISCQIVPSRGLPAEVTVHGRSELIINHIFDAIVGPIGWKEGDKKVQALATGR